MGKKNILVNYELLSIWLKLLEDREYVKLRNDLLRRRKSLQFTNKKATVLPKVNPYSDSNVIKKANKFRSDLISKQTESEVRFKALLNIVELDYDFQKIFYYIKFKKNFYYIVDFYIPSKNIVFEIDGGYHYDSKQIKLDDERTRILKRDCKITEVLRFTNDEILNHQDATLERLKIISKTKLFDKPKIVDGIEVFKKVSKKEFNIIMNDEKENSKVK